MIISSFNIQNDYKCYKEEKSKVIYSYLKDNKIDVLGLQEVFSKCDKDLDKICTNYNKRGNYRFISRLILRSINEKNPIITKHNIISYKTYHLPFFPSFTKRVLTNIVIEYKGMEISIYNTHLEVDKDKVKIKQLNRIFSILKNDKRPKILMGDFNLKNNNDIFNKFSSDLNDMGINRVEFNHKTFKESKYSREIDHIFYSDDFKIKNKKVITDLEISDHYPIIVELEKN